MAFLLDVLEHIDDDDRVLVEIRRAIRPGGYLVVATPALERFRTSVDNMTHHVRRYSRGDFEQLARRTGFELIVSPLLHVFSESAGLARTAQHAGPRRHDSAGRSADTSTRADRIPIAPLNPALATLFAAETPLGAWCPFHGERRFSRCFAPSSLIDVQVRKSRQSAASSSNRMISRGSTSSTPCWIRPSKTISEPIPRFRRCSAARPCRVTRYRRPLKNRGL